MRAFTQRSSYWCLLVPQVLAPPAAARTVRGHLPFSKNSRSASSAQLIEDSPRFLGSGLNLRMIYARTANGRMVAGCPRFRLRQDKPRASIQCARPAGSSASAGAPLIKCCIVSLTNNFAICMARTGCSGVEFGSYKADHSATLLHPAPCVPRYWCHTWSGSLPRASFKSFDPRCGSVKSMRGSFTRKQ